MIDWFSWQASSPRTGKLLACRYDLPCWDPSIPLPIPYQAQKSLPESSLCGAASLCMVYASLGLDLTQEEVWPRINQKTWLGRRARSYKLAHDALERGLNACVLQIRDSRRALLDCLRQSVRAIINHRMSRTSRNGHYSVLVDADEAGVVLHDPQLGANRTLAWPDLEQMWLPGCKEITGHILVVFAPRSHGEGNCPDCQTFIPEQIECMNCKKPVLLRPLAELTCWNCACPRCWLDKLFCPHCDFSNLLPAPVS